eukprot:8798323-Pyramimonas_sp.AAC.2
MSYTNTLGRASHKFSLSKSPPAPSSKKRCSAPRKPGFPGCKVGSAVRRQFRAVSRRPARAKGTEVGDPGLGSWEASRGLKVWLGDPCLACSRHRGRRLGFLEKVDRGWNLDLDLDLEKADQQGLSLVQLAG